MCLHPTQKIPMLRCVAVCCSVSQCVAVRCSALQCVKDTFKSDDIIFIKHRKACVHIRRKKLLCCSVLQCVAVCCSVLQCVAMCCSVSQCVAVRCSALQCAKKTHSKVMTSFASNTGRHVSTSDAKNSCVAVCCSVLQCVAVHRVRECDRQTHRQTDRHTLPYRQRQISRTCTHSFKSHARARTVSNPTHVHAQFQNLHQILHHMLTSTQIKSEWKSMWREGR